MVPEIPAPWCTSLHNPFPLSVSGTWEYDRILTSATLYQVADSGEIIPLALKREAAML